MVSNQVVSYIPTERGRQQALQNMYDQLREGGMLTVILFNWRSLFTQGQAKDEYSSGIGGSHLHRFTPAEASAALHACGFKNVHVRGYANFGVYSYWKDRFWHLQHVIALSDAFVSKFGISRYRGYWIVCTADK